MLQLKEGVTRRSLFPLLQNGKSRRALRITTDFECPSLPRENGLAGSLFVSASIDALVKETSPSPAYLRLHTPSIHQEEDPNPQKLPLETAARTSHNRCGAPTKSKRRRCRDKSLCLKMPEKPKKRKRENERIREKKERIKRRLVDFSSFRLPD